MFFLVSFIDFLFRTTPKNTSTVPDGAVAATSTEVPRKRSQIVSPRIMGMGCFFRQKNTVYRCGNARKTHGFAWIKNEKLLKVS